MSHQCSCGRDLNNNYVSYTNAYANANTIDRGANASLSGGGNGKSSAASSISMATTRSMATSGGHAHTQLTAKVMFGSCSAIKELREKEEKSRQAARAGQRRN